MRGVRYFTGKLWGIVALLCIPSAPLHAATCFQEAPSNATVKHLFDAAPLPRLIAAAANDVRNVMNEMRGKWSGMAKGYWCLGTAQAPQTRPDDYTVDAAIDGGAANQLKLVATMHSDQGNGTHTERLALFLVHSQFYVDTPAQPDNTHMQARSIAPGRVSFAQLAYPPTSGRVIARTIDVHGDSLTIGVDVYTHDILTSASTWHLTRTR